MQSHDLRSALSALPELRVTGGVTEAEAAAAMQVLTSFNRCMVGLVRFSGEGPRTRPEPRGRRIG